MIAYKYLDKRLPLFGQTIVSYKFKCFAIIALSLIIFTYKYDFLALDTNGSAKNSQNLFYFYYNLAQKNISNSKLVNKTFTILLWTKYFGSDEMDEQDLTQLKCRHRNCRLTSNRTLLSTADGLLFHWRDINIIDLPDDSPIGQKWILYNMESPINSPLKQLYPLADRIDWTMTYRTDSDIYTPYGRVVECDRQRRPKARSHFREKTGDIAWIVSHCFTSSKREDYVDQLSEYIDVDIYGGCGPNQCPRNESCLLSIEKTYKFYLSFENSLCKDYVTEKLFAFIDYDIIPIVYGAANYSAIMPNHSYINIMDYSSPKLLAEHLRRIGGDENEYNSYFSWKDRHCVVNTGWDSLCDMCEKFNTAVRDQRTNKLDLIKWWFNDSNCDTDIHF